MGPLIKKNILSYLIYRGSTKPSSLQLGTFGSVEATVFEFYCLQNFNFVNAGAFLSMESVALAMFDQAFGNIWSTMVFKFGLFNLF